ncbi:MAG: FAD-dependent monooxygenase, partial [Candidatus Aenigmatarchaeota archaeon]
MDYDAIVVGAGPSGSSCATFLGRKGIKTLLLDKTSFPRDKTCGDGITGKSIAILEELGVHDKMNEVQHSRINGFLTATSADTQIAFDGTENPGYACKRYLFDNIVFEEAKKNADVIENFEVTDLLFEGGRVVGVKGTGKDKN